MSGRWTVRFLSATGEPLARVEARGGAWLTGVAARAGVPIVHDCDGQGVCGTCRVRVAGPLAAPDLEERAQLGADLERGWRLCCRVRVEGDLVVGLPEPGFAYPPDLQRG